MKNTNKVIIRLSTWYDSVTKKSAKIGEYTSTGNDYQKFEIAIASLDDLNTDLVAELLADYISYFKNDSWDSHDSYIQETLQSIDPEIDYKTGEEYYNRLDLSVLYDDDRLKFLAQQVRNKLNTEIEEMIANI